jgi:hypothetical protein
LLLLGLLSVSSALGGTVYNFESCNLGAIGVWSGGPPPGCDAWYTPTVSGTDAAVVRPYTDLQGLGLAVDPTGGNYLLTLATTVDAATRAQHDFNYSASAIWSVSYDLDVVNATNTGADTSYGTAYIGSFAVMRTSTSGSAFTAVDAWDSSATDSTWSILYFAYDASNHALNSGNGVAAWTGLPQDHWYRESTVFDDKTNQILLVSLTDLTTGVTSSFSPSGWYMSGGAAGTFNWNAFRVAGFGSTNALAVDNFDLDAVPEPATLLLTGLGLIGLIAFRRR